jgi:ubiquinone/menaquinone biosynthesis C-methylase UbiE
MFKLPSGKYDAVYCSHTLEHFYRHEVPAVFKGFQHVLKPTGFAHVAVPDIEALFKSVRGKDIDDVWYVASGGPITFHDVLYGWDKQMAGGNGYYAHKCGFTEKTLSETLMKNGFPYAFTATDKFNLFAFAFKKKPSTTLLHSLGV